MSLSVNGAPVVGGRITLPENGRWVASLALVSEELEEGASVVLLSDDSQLSLVGTVLRGAKSDSDQLDLLVVGGAGKLDDSVEAQGYESTTAEIIASSICSAVGESLAPSPELSTLLLPSWSRAEGPASQALDALSSEIEIPWRVNALGLVEFSVLSYPTSDDEAAVELERDEAAGELVLSVEMPRLMPGTTIRGVEARTVIHDLESLTTRVFYRGPERIRDAFAKLVRRALPQIDYLARYEAKVVRQLPDDTLELIPTDTRIGGLSKVPIRVPAPGFRLLVEGGATVLLGWDGGDPRKPFCEAFASGHTIRLDIKADEVRLGDPDTATLVALAAKVDANFASLKTAVTGWTPVANDGGAAGKTALLGALNSMPSVAAADTKAS